MDKKQAYEQKLKAQLDEWSAKIDTFKAKADKVEAAAKVEYYETIEDLKAKKAVAKKKLEELHQSSDNAWGDLKAGVELAWESLEDAVKSATSRFN